MIGIQMGLGFALTEDIDVDPLTGIVKGDSFANYQSQLRRCLRSWTQMRFACSLG